MVCGHRGSGGQLVGAFGACLSSLRSPTRRRCGQAPAPAGKVPFRGHRCGRGPPRGGRVPRGRCIRWPLRPANAGPPTANKSSINTARPPVTSRRGTYCCAESGVPNVRYLKVRRRWPTRRRSPTDPRSVLSSLTARFDGGPGAAEGPVREALASRCESVWARCPSSELRPRSIGPRPSGHQRRRGAVRRGGV